MLVKLASSNQLPDGVVVLTGGSRGIGRELVKLLLNSGFNVVNLSREACEEPPNLVSIAADLSLESGLRVALRELRNYLNGRSVAALVNCAGTVEPLGSLLRLSHSDVFRSLCLMAVAPAQLASVISPLMPRGGRILNLSSRSAQTTLPGLGAYCMSKHALHALTESLRFELSPDIGVAELIPGEVDTAMQACLREADPTDFPLCEFFSRNQNNLIPSDIAAYFCYWVLTQTTAEEFNRAEPWYIYEKEQLTRWLHGRSDFPYTAP